MRQVESIAAVWAVGANEESITSYPLDLRSTYTMPRGREEEEHTVSSGQWGEWGLDAASCWALCV